MSTNTGSNVTKPSRPTSEQWTSELQCHVNGCLSPFPALASLVTIRKLGMNGRFTNDIISSGLVPRLIELLDWNHTPEIQYESTWILTNIVAGTSDQTRVVMEQNGHQKLIHLVNHQSLNIRHTAIEALGNIAGDCSEFRNQLLEHDLLSHLLPYCTPIHSDKILRSVTWTLGGLCRTHPPPKRESVELILKALSTLIFSEDDEILTNVCWAYCHLLRADDMELSVVLNSCESKENIINQYTQKSIAEYHHFTKAMASFHREVNDHYNSDQPIPGIPEIAGTNQMNQDQKQRVLYIPSDIMRECYKHYALFSESKVRNLHNNVVRRMVSLLDPSTNGTVLHSAVVAFGNMQRSMTESDLITLHREYGILHRLCRLLDLPQVNVRRDCCWVISNIIVTLSAGNDCIIESGIIPKVMSTVKKDKYQVAMEAMWALANAVEKYYELVISLGIIETVFGFMLIARDKESFVFTIDILGSIVHATGGEYMVARDVGRRMVEVNAIGCIMRWAENHSSMVDTRLQQRIDTILTRLQRYLSLFDV